MPDRVIDAPIPDDLRELHARVVGKRWQHLMMDKDTLMTPHALAELIERISRLEAEKQAAHTEGWMRAVHAILADMQASNTLRVFVSYYRDKFSNPTAAKPEPSPSSANRAEGRP